MALSKGRLATMKRQITKLVAESPQPGQGADWLALWRFFAVRDAVLKHLPHDTECRSEVATAYIVEKEAEHLGIADNPDLQRALDELRFLIAWVRLPAAVFLRVMSRELGPLDEREECALRVEAVQDASTRAAGCILTAWGCPGDRPMGPHPRSGRSLPEQTVMPPWFEHIGTALPAWLAELAAIQLDTAKVEAECPAS